MNIFLAEFIGTALLMLLGNGVVASCVLKGTKASGSDWMVITTAWAFAVFNGGCACEWRTLESCGYIGVGG